MGNFKTSEIAFHLSELHQRYIEFRKKVTTILATLRNKKRAEERKRKAAETIKSANKVRIKQEPGTNNTVISSATDVTVTGPQPTSPPQTVRSQAPAPQVQSVTNYYPPTTYRGGSSLQSSRATRTPPSDICPLSSKRNTP